MESKKIVRKKLIEKAMAKERAARNMQYDV
jgi:hypothetical protein